MEYYQYDVIDVLFTALASPIVIQRKKRWHSLFSVTFHQIFFLKVGGFKIENSHQFSTFCDIL